MDQNISPLEVNGLRGRVLRFAPQAGKQRRLVLFYGHHSSLERWYGLAKAMNDFGSVTMPDLPGFGGMDSFYKLGQKPTLDNFADYAAAFIKQEFADGKVTVVGMSFGFALATRMLQRHPELTDRVELLVSLVGFAHHDDFKLKTLGRVTYRFMAAVFSQPVMDQVWRVLFLSRPVLHFTYITLGHAKFRGLNPEEQKAALDAEVVLWRVNDIRTHMYTLGVGVAIDNTAVKINLPVYHLSTKGDHLLDNQKVEMHMRQVFTDFHTSQLDEDKHAPTMLSEAEARKLFINTWLQQLLA